MRQNVVLIQMDIVFGEPDKNYQNVKTLFAKADLHQGDLVVLPEMWNTGYDLTRLAEIADVEGQQTQACLIALAKQYHVTIFGGSVAVRVADQYVNRAYIVDSNGTVITYYDKVHLFGLMHEEKYLSAGNQTGHYQQDGFNYAALICYDLRFPEWFKVQASLGSNVFILCAQWPKPRIEQWKKLLVARAIENQAYIIAVNRVGCDPENEYNGHSLVVDPTGEIILELTDNEQIAQVELELDKIQQARQAMSVLSDTRPDFYEQIRKGGNNDAN